MRGSLLLHKRPIDIGLTGLALSLVTISTVEYPRISIPLKFHSLQVNVVVESKRCLGKIRSTVTVDTGVRGELRTSRPPYIQTLVVLQTPRVKIPQQSSESQIAQSRGLSVLYQDKTVGSQSLGYRLLTD